MKRIRQLMSLLTMFAIVCMAASLVAKNAPMPVVEAMAEDEAARNIAQMEEEFTPNLSVHIEALSEEEKQNIAQQLQGGTVTFLNNSVGALSGLNNELSLIIPSSNIGPDNISNLYSWMAHVLGAYDKTSLNYVLVHWTNHLREVGLSVNDVGLCALYVQSIVKAAIAGQGVMFYRPASAVYQEAYLIVAKIDGYMWGQWFDAIGRPITGYVQNQKTLDAITVKYVKDGMTLLSSADDLPPELLKNWTGKLPNSLTYYVWGLQAMVRTAAMQAGYNVEHAWNSSVLAALHLQLAPPVPIFINPCLFDNVGLCGEVKRLS